MVQQSKTGNPAIRLGLLYGAGLGILLLLNALLNLLLAQNSIPGIVSFIVFAITIAAYFYAGYQAAAVTGKVSTGLIAGLMTGLVSSLINLVGYLILSFVFYDTLRARVEQSIAQTPNAGRIQVTQTLIIGSIAASLVIGLVIAVLAGLGFGALGGVVGKSRAPLPPQAYTESYYQGMGNPQQPGAYPPPPPSYPPQEGNWPQNPQ